MELVIGIHGKSEVFLEFSKSSIISTIFFLNPPDFSMNFIENQGKSWKLEYISGESGAQASRLENFLERGKCQKRAKSQETFVFLVFLRARKFPGIFLENVLVDNLLEPRVEKFRIFSIPAG